MIPDFNSITSGTKIQISPDYPKMKLSDDVPVSPEFREEINQWMLQFFGYTNIVPDGEGYFIGNHTIVVNPRTYEAAKNYKRCYR